MYRSIAHRIDVCQYDCMGITENQDRCSDTTEVCCAVASDVAMSSVDAVRAASLFKTLGDPVRLRILSLVAASVAGELCACDLPGLLDRSQGTTSHHLSQLVSAGFLEREQRGKWAWFRVRTETLVGLAGALTPSALLSSASSGDLLT